MNRHVMIIKRWLLFFMVALFLSGLTAIPVEKEIAFASKLVRPGSEVWQWLNSIGEAFREMNSRFPFFTYGYDWLAFAHFVLALLFIGPYRDPVKNKWVIEFGILACLMIIPYALVAGHYRQIPVWWRLVDCSFGVLGLVPLLICMSRVRKLEMLHDEEGSTAQPAFGHY